MKSCIQRLSLPLVYLLLGGCAAPPPPVVSQSAEEMDISRAIDHIAQSLSRQLRPQRSQLEELALQAQRSAAGKVEPSTIVVDRIVDARTGQTNALSKRVESALSESLTQRLAGMRVLPMTSRSLQRNHYLLTGSITLDRFQGDERRYRLNVSIVEIATRLVAAQDSVWLKGPQETAPEQVFRESPVVPSDAVVDAQRQTSTARPGVLADPRYIEQLPTGALLNEAESLYNNGNVEGAADLFRTASSRVDGKTLRTYSGLYLSTNKLGRKQDAESAFEGLIKEGIANQNISIRFLFRVGSTEFVDDPVSGSQYPMWLKTLAKQLMSSKSCVEISGHTSRTGSETLNERLSTFRAENVLRHLIQIEPALKPKLRHTGKGYKENIVGTGADDASDAVDRRVEFKLLGC